MPKRGNRNLTIKEQKFVAARISGKTNREAFREAGYSINKKQLVNDVSASMINTRPNVQAAIDAGLAKAGLTPEYAIEQLAKIVEQDDEMGAKRLAIKDVLELHGWNKADKPQVHVKIEGDFFGASRGRVVEGEVVDENN